MDPLSVAASIIAVAGALYSVSRKLRSCANTIAYAAKEVKAIAKEISLFSILLRSLQNTYVSLASQVSQAADLREICEGLVVQARENVGEFDIFLKGLKPLQDSSDADLISKTYARVKWAFQKTDLLLLRSKLESSKSTLNLCMVTIQARLSVEMLEAAQRDMGDEMKVRRLTRQVRLLKLQLHDQRSILEDAVATSTKIEYLIRRQVRGSVNLKVAKEALSLAKEHLEKYNGQSYPEVDHHPTSVPSSDSSDSSPRPGPTRLPSPPPSPRLPATRSSPHRPPVPTRDAGRRRSTMAADMTSSGTWVFPEPGASSNTRSGSPGQGRHPTTTDVNIDMGYRTARTLAQRASRVRDADRNVVWTKNRHGDDEGL